jgi:hypothetical protein
MRAIFILLFSSVCFAQQTRIPENPLDKYIVQKDKSGKPLPVCEKDQKSTEEKPCRQSTISQRNGGSGRG